MVWRVLAHAPSKFDGTDSQAGLELTGKESDIPISQEIGNLGYGV